MFSTQKKMLFLFEFNLIRAIYNLLHYVGEDRL